MSGILLLLIAIILTLIAYRFYGSYLSQLLSLDNRRKTPAHTRKDGIDYIPTPPAVLLGHHFASIAGAGPIVGPIIALAFGWLPAYIWIIVGVIFIGAVHDFTSVVASIRHDGKSIGEIIENNIGFMGKQLFLVFAWATLLLVVATFLDIVAKTFEHNPAVASASVFFIILAFLFGMALYKLKLPLGLLTLGGVFLLFVCIYLGALIPIVQSQNFWVVVLIIYISVASIIPVWILLQPRDYLNSFLLYVLMAGALIGIFFFHPQIQINVYEGFIHPGLGPLFPILFVTVACGSISGFHSLVASGTTAKQLSKEEDAKLIGYGGMLIEGVLAVVAIIAGASLSSTEFSQLFNEGKFIPIFSAGVSKFLTAIPFLNISESTGKTFTSLAVSAFALTSLDTATRLARFIFQEFFDYKKSEPVQTVKQLVQNRYFATFVTVFLASLLLLTGNATKIWPLFGSANQLLAALALLAVSAWLSREKIFNYITVIPMIFMYLVTATALVSLIYKNFFENANYLIGVLASLLLILAFLLAVRSFRIIFRTKFGN